MGRLCNNLIKDTTKFSEVGDGVGGGRKVSQVLDIIALTYLIPELKLLECG